MAKGPAKGPGKGPAKGPRKARANEEEIGGRARGGRAPARGDAGGGMGIGAKVALISGLVTLVCIGAAVFLSGAGSKAKDPDAEKNAFGYHAAAVLAGPGARYYQGGGGGSGGGGLAHYEKIYKDLFGQEGAEQWDKWIKELTSPIPREIESDFAGQKLKERQEAFRKGLAQAASVVPVVITSSTRIRFEPSSGGPRHRKACRRLRCRSARLRPLCGRVRRRRTSRPGARGQPVARASCTASSSAWLKPRRWRRVQCKGTGTSQQGPGGAGLGAASMACASAAPADRARRNLRAWTRWSTGKS